MIPQVVRFLDQSCFVLCFNVCSHDFLYFITLTDSPKRLVTCIRVLEISYPCLSRSIILALNSTIPSSLNAPSLVIEKPRSKCFFNLCACVSEWHITFLLSFYFHLSSLHIVKEGKSGKFMGLALSPKVEQQAPQKTKQKGSGFDDFDDAPF